jgi:minor extracellular protease Epr
MGNGPGDQPSENGYVRLIAHTISDVDKIDFAMKGCRIIHDLDDATAISCPAGIAKKLSNVEEDQILTIMDLTADIQIGAYQVWTSSPGYTGSGVVVAVLDTGVDTTHAELSDSIYGGRSFVSSTSSYRDDNGHGTHVSGIITADGIASQATGVAPDAQVWMGKVCDAQGSCYYSDIAEGIEYVVNNNVAKIISISLGGGGTTQPNCDRDYLANKVNWAVSRGVTVVAAAGNDGTKVSSPACASGAVAVGAVNRYDLRASFSGKGKALDIMAPGVSIYSTVPGGGYASWSGTSMATPHVSATVALMKQKNPYIADKQIKDTLYRTAKDLGTKGWDQLYGYGRVDAFRAVTAS